MSALSVAAYFGLIFSGGLSVLIGIGSMKGDLAPSAFRGFVFLMLLASVSLLAAVHIVGAAACVGSAT